MKRFNLLLVTKENGLREVALRSLSKVYKSNFVFEVPSLEEAENMLSKLHIDILMVDLDLGNVNLVKLTASHPELQIIGLSANPRNVQANIDLHRHQVLEKRDLGPALLAELKGLKKGIGTETVVNRKPNQTRAAATDFRDFFKLAPQGLGGN
jgi:hypothetical protein